MITWLGILSISLSPASVIRKAISGVEHSKFDTMETRLAEYKSSKSAVGRLLARSNLVMTDTLLVNDVVTKSHSITSRTVLVCGP